MILLMCETIETIIIVINENIKVLLVMTYWY